jgi:hypothetical protein
MNPQGVEASMVDASRIAWRKSSRSTNNGECVEVGVWRKSVRSSNNGQCVEVATCSCCSVAVRDSKNPEGPKLAFAAREWGGFARRVKSGGYDLL